MSVVPQNRLLLMAALVFLPLSILAALVPVHTGLVFVLCGCLFVVAVVDGFKAPRRVATIRIHLPQTVRLTHQRQGQIELQIAHDGRAGSHLRLGLALPPEIDSPYRELRARLPQTVEPSTIRWPCKGLKQGRYLLQKCYFEVLSPWGLWAVRSRVPAQSELRVYPNLMVERKKLSSLFLNRGFGIHAQRQVGKGREFEQLREYSPGDCFEDVYWKATAKRGQPITKVFQIERTQQIYLIIDSSRLSARPFAVGNSKVFNAGDTSETTTSTILERYVAAALTVCFAAERQGDVFGMLTFDDQVRHFVSAKNGKLHFNTCRDTIYSLQARKVAPDLRELLTFISNRIRRRALLVFLTHLDDPALAESFCENIKMISRRHLVMVNMLKPPFTRPLFSSTDISTNDDIYRHLAGHLLWKRLRETGKTLARQGVGFSLLENENLCTDLISQYLSLKRRQVL